MKVAIFGAGRMGKRHMQNVQAMGLEIAGICDTRQESVEAAGEELQIPKERCFSNADELLALTKPNCVIVATTAPSHASLTTMSAQAGAQYILCEKPMATSLADCQRMIEVCKQNGTQLAINHQMRFMEQYAGVKKIVTSEEFGGLSSVTVMAGNFGIAMNGTHYFEMFRYITDELPTQVSAWFSENTVANPRGPEFQDRAGSIRLVNPSGTRFYMDVGDDQGHGVKVIYTGRYGQVVSDELVGTMTISVRDAQYRELPTTRYGMPSIDEQKRVEPADALIPSRRVLEALLSGADIPTGEIGFLTIKALVAAYISNENNHVAVAIDDHLPMDRMFPWA